MKQRSEINNCWELAEQALGIKNLKSSFSPYSWFDNADYLISKYDHWSGWWNDYYNFIIVWAKTATGIENLNRMKELFEERGWAVSEASNNGYSFGYATMTKEESREKADRNLMNGGRMSD